MSEERLVKLTVNLTARAHAALGAASAMTDLSKTDCVNRALKLYASVEEIAQHTGTYRMTIRDWDERGDLHLVVSRERPKRRWLPW